jgi:hypothetical protein
MADLQAEVRIQDPPLLVEGAADNNPRDWWYTLEWPVQ